MRRGAPPGLWPNDGNREGVVDGVGTVVADFVGTRELEFEHDPKARDDGFHQFLVAEVCFALDIGTEERPEEEVRSGGLYRQHGLPWITDKT